MSRGCGALTVSSWWITVIWGAPRTRATQNEADANQPDTTFCGVTRVRASPVRSRKTNPQLSNETEAGVVPSDAFGRGRLQCGEARLEAFVFGARLGGHLLDRLEFLA